MTHPRFRQGHGRQVGFIRVSSVPLSFPEDGSLRQTAEVKPAQLPGFAAMCRGKHYDIFRVSFAGIIIFMDGTCLACCDWSGAISLPLTGLTFSCPDISSFPCCSGCFNVSCILRFNVASSSVSSFISPSLGQSVETISRRTGRSFSNSVLSFFRFSIMPGIRSNALMKFITANFGSLAIYPLL